MRKVLYVLVAALFAVAVAYAGGKPVHPKQFPPGRPFSPGILSGGTLYVSGMTGSNPAGGGMPEKFEDEVKQCLDNIGLVLKEAGMGYRDDVTVQVYLTDMELFQRMNAVYTTVFAEPRPARTTVGVAKLVGTAKIEITVTARK
jgi:2-iminobutanoate/2-iminopropanoate deaminase